MTANETLAAHIEMQLGHRPDNLHLVLPLFQSIEVKHQTMLLTQGQVCKSVYFVAKGCLQVFVYDADGNESTRDIVTENQWCTELVSFSKQLHATENIRVVEDSALCAISLDAFQQAMQSVPEFDVVYKKILEASYANSVYRLNSFVSLTALERMKWLMEYRPKLMNRLTSKLLASYLGISQETYSRLKAKL